MTGKVEGAIVPGSDIYRGGSSNRAPFFSIKMNDSVSRRDCGVPGNGSDVTLDELLLRDRAPLCARSFRLLESFVCL